MNGAATCTARFGIPSRRGGLWAMLNSSRPFHYTTRHATSALLVSALLASAGWKKANLITPLKRAISITTSRQEVLGSDVFNYAKQYV